MKAGYYIVYYTPGSNRFSNYKTNDWIFFKYADNRVWELGYCNNDTGGKYHKHNNGPIFVDVLDTTDNSLNKVFDQLQPVTKEDAFFLLL